MKISWESAVGALAITGPVVNAISLDVTNTDSIKEASKTVASGLVEWYHGDTDAAQLGVLPPPYYWWEGGAMWGALVDYWHYTGDDTYNDITSQALLSQVGPNFDYMVAAHTKDEGNDDQGFWGFSTMDAAERNYTAPPSNIPSWLSLTINLWNTMAARWDTSTCGGGLRWQIFSFNAGYNYKNTVSNGAFMQLAARLGRYTGNSTYTDWVEKVWDWETTIGLIDSGYAVYDGTDDTTGCTVIDHVQWTYSLGIHLFTAAVMYNITEGSDIWKQRVEGLLTHSSVFFSPSDSSKNIMFESACEITGTCNTDQYSFKGYLARFMYKTTQMAPFTAAAIATLMQASAQGAAQSCSGGSDGITCGQHWYTDGWDGNYGAGQELSALEVIQGLLVAQSVSPFTSNDIHIAINPSSVSSASVPTQTSTSVVEKVSPTATTATGSATSATRSATSATESTTESSAHSKKKGGAGHNIVSWGLALTSMAVLCGTMLLFSMAS